MAGLAELAVGAGRLRLGADIVGLHARGIEADIDGLTGTHVGDWTGGVASTGEAHGIFAVLESNKGL